MYYDDDMLTHTHTQTYFLPVIGLVEPKDLSPGDLVVSQPSKRFLF